MKTQRNKFFFNKGVLWHNKISDDSYFLKNFKTLTIGLIKLFYKHINEDY